MAGLVISESEYSHQALSDIMPLRDLFGLLFVVSVGMLLDPASLVASSSALVCCGELSTWTEIFLPSPSMGEGESGGEAGP